MKEEKKRPLSFSSLGGGDARSTLGSQQMTKRRKDSQTEGNFSSQFSPIKTQAAGADTAGSFRVNTEQVGSTAFSGRYVVARKLSENFSSSNIDFPRLTAEPKGIDLTGILRTIKKNYSEHQPGVLPDRLSQRSSFRPSTQASVHATPHISGNQLFQRDLVSPPLLLTSSMSSSASSQTKKEETNIFNGSFANKLSSAGFMEFDRGPRFSQGKIIPYSIVGTPEDYIKVASQIQVKKCQQGSPIGMTISRDILKTGRRQIKRKTTVMIAELGGQLKDLMASSQQPPCPYPQDAFFSRSVQSIVMPASLQNTSQISRAETPVSLANSRAPTANTVDLRSENKQKREGNGQYNRKARRNDLTEKSKGELLSEMHQARVRIEIRKQQEEQQVKALDFDWRLDATREERVLEKYQEYEQYWARGPSPTKRVGTSIIQKSSNFRKKIELADVHDNLLGQLTDPRSWECKLREDSVQSTTNLDAESQLPINPMNIRDFILPKDCHLDFMSRFTICPTKKPSQLIEFIQKPREGTERSTWRGNFRPWQTSSSSSSSSFLATKVEILHSTILDSVKNIKEPQLFIPTADDLNELIVEGNNVFQKELESLQNDGHPSAFKYDKFDFVKGYYDPSEQQQGPTQQKEMDKPKPQIGINDNFVIQKNYSKAELAKKGKKPVLGS